MKVYARNSARPGGDPKTSIYGWLQCENAKCEKFAYLKTNKVPTKTRKRPRGTCSRSVTVPMPSPEVPRNAQHENECSEKMKRRSVLNGETRLFCLMAAGRPETADTLCAPQAPTCSVVARENGGPSTVRYAQQYVTRRRNGRNSNAARQNIPADGTVVMRYY